MHWCNSSSPLLAFLMYFYALFNVFFASGDPPWWYGGSGLFQDVSLWVVLFTIFGRQPLSHIDLGDCI